MLKGEPTGQGVPWCKACNGDAASQQGVHFKRANGPSVAQCEACYADKVCLKKACTEKRANGPRCAPAHGVLGDQACIGKACTQK